MAQATLTISSRNYSSWSLRGWLLAKMSGLDFDVEIAPLDDPATRAELLLLSPSMLVPCLRHDGLTIWNNLAIGEYLHEIRPEAGILPPDRERRARCRSISGEMQAGFAPLRSALPMNLKASFPTFRVFSRAQADVDRILTIWRDGLGAFGGPWLLGERRSMADAMYAPVATRFRTYHVPIDRICQDYCDRVLDTSEMREWDAAARAEPDEIEELEMEF